MMGSLRREIDQVAKDKGIDRAEIIGALEEAMKQAARREKGQDREIEARYNEELGEVELFEFREVVEEITDDETQITLDRAREFDPEAELGDEIGVKVDSTGFGRILAQTAKQVIIQRIREAERENVYEEYKDRQGEIVNGIVRRFEKGAIIVDLGRAEAVLPLREQVPRENYRPNDRLRAYVIEVNKPAKGSQIILSRTCIEMLTKCFEQEVPEMYEGIVTIQSAAREPGGRSRGGATWAASRTTFGWRSARSLVGRRYRRSSSSRWPWASAPTSRSSAWSTRCCCGRCRLPIPIGWSASTRSAAPRSVGC